MWLTLLADYEVMKLVEFKVPDFVDPSIRKRTSTEFTSYIYIYNHIIEGVA